jgi:hypothetical protein
LQKEEPSNRKKQDPIDDALYTACRVYMKFIGRGKGNSDKKSSQYALIEELLMDRIKAGEVYPMPDEHDIPTRQLEQSDYYTEEQTVKIVAGVMRELESRRRARYQS